MIGGEYYTPARRISGFDKSSFVFPSLPTTAVNDYPINLGSGNVGCKDIPWLVITISVTVCCSSEHSTIGGAELMFNDELLLG